MVNDVGGKKEIGEGGKECSKVVGLERGEVFFEQKKALWWGA